MEQYAAASHFENQKPTIVNRQSSTRPVSWVVRPTADG
jgi:hypothetical protein